MKTISNFNALELQNSSNVEGGTFGLFSGLLGGFHGSYSGFGSLGCGCNNYQQAVPAPAPIVENYASDEAQSVEYTQPTYSHSTYSAKSYGKCRR